MKKFLLLLLMLICYNNTNGEEKNSVLKFEIKNNWQFNQNGNDKWYPAFVPGQIHTDLLENKLIDDPYFGINEQNLQWIGEKNWNYKTVFEVNEEILNKKNIEMVFKGLDTYADVFLNGEKILSADNMFREWKVNCRSLLKPGSNELLVKFRNVFDENMPKWENAPYRLMAYDNNDQADIKLNMYSRKAGYHYGWDWGPRLVTYGIWRPVYIEAWDDVKLNYVFVVQKNVTKENAEINTGFEIESEDTLQAAIKVFVNGEELIRKQVELKPGINKPILNFNLINPRLWWSNGLGEQYLYNFKFVVETENCTTEKSEKIGIRSLEIIREKDQYGKSFYVKLNGIPVFAKGANYIPQDNFVNRIAPERYEHIVKSAADANMNILRIWGGGIYQDDQFYELCDKYGILLWHDLMFACAMYPSDQQFYESVKYELIDNIKRIRNHSSIALYCGNNENDIGWFKWGWKTKYNEVDQKKYEASLKYLFHEFIPSIIEEVDSTRYYHPSSPSADWAQFSPDEGDVHYWSVWHGKEPFEKFNHNIGRFMSEYGFQSYPEMNSIKKFTNPEDRDLHSEVMLSHQRCMSDERRDKEYGNRLIQWYMDRQFNQPKDFENYIYVAQVLQAEGIKSAIEAHRRNMPKCMGSMYWQIDDCWPVASWSSIDYYGKWKALHYYARNSYSQILAAPYFNNGQIDFYVVSDKLEDTEATLEIRTLDFSGTSLFSRIIPITVKANSSHSYLQLTKNELIGNSDETKVFVNVKVTANGAILSENNLFFRNQKELALEKPQIHLNVSKIGTSYHYELTTDKLAKNVYLSFDEAGGFFSDNYFDLIPGTAKQVTFTTPKSITADDQIRIQSLFDTY
ncbi:MAG: glycoside hydrolase family 2 protein [Bacteroidota bacterium]